MTWYFSLTWSRIDLPAQQRLLLILAMCHALGTHLSPLLRLSIRGRVSLFAKWDALRVSSRAAAALGQFPDRSSLFTCNLHAPAKLLLTCKQTQPQSSNTIQPLPSS
jgi:hypothetical protein